MAVGKKRYEFIYEWTDYHRRKAVLTIIISSLILVALFFAGWNFFWEVIRSSAPFEAVKTYVLDDVRQVTPLGIFYISFFGDIFFNPIPPEIFYISGLIKGNPPYLSLVLVLAGTVLAQILNYFIGSKCHGFFKYFVSKKNLYKIRRKVNKYGSYAVFIFNVTPLPSPVLTFALGITKYNVYRLFSVLLVATIIRYGVITLFYTFFA